MPISFLLPVPIIVREPLKSQPNLADGYVIETYTLTGTHDLAGLYGSSPLNHPYLERVTGNDPASSVWKTEAHPFRPHQHYFV